jgi:hypothetical protein
MAVFIGQVADPAWIRTRISPSDLENRTVDQELLSHPYK